MNPQQPPQQRGQSPQQRGQQATRGTDGRTGEADQPKPWMPPNAQNTPNAEKYLLEADALRRRQLRSAILHGSSRTWREHKRVWPAVIAGVIVVAVILAAYTVMNAVSSAREQEQKEAALSSSSSTTATTPTTATTQTTKASSPSPSRDSNTTTTEQTSRPRNNSR